jgi:hypothetical protein
MVSLCLFASLSLLTFPSEIRVELNLPESSIANIKYPDKFPSPPTDDSSGFPPDPLPSSASPEMASSSMTDQLSRQFRPLNSFSESQEKSWYYYLSEIALRRIGNNVLNTFYTKDEYPGVDMPIQLMITTVTNFLDQMSQWYISSKNLFHILKSNRVLGTMVYQQSSGSIRTITVTFRKKKLHI